MLASLGRGAQLPERPAKGKRPALWNWPIGKFVCLLHLYCEDVGTNATIYLVHS